MRLPSFTLFAFSILALCACGTRNIKPDETPEAHEGIAFMRVRLHGAPSAMVHLFTKRDRIGPHKARIDAIEGDRIYAVIMAQGEYDIGQISAGGMTHLWFQNTLCPPFNVVEGKNNYIGTLSLTFEPSKWFALTRRYQVSCNTTTDDDAEAWKMFRNSYERLYTTYK